MAPEIYSIPGSGSEVHAGVNAGTSKPRQRILGH